MNSVERLFESVLNALPPEVVAHKVELPFESTGLIRRCRNLYFTRRLRADVVHVTGDITYCAIARHGSPCLLTILDLVSTHRLKGWRLWVLKTFWYRIPLWSATHATTISHEVATELKQAFDVADHDLSVVHCPVTSGMRPRVSEPPPTGPFRVLQIGTLPNKNLEATAAAVSGTDLQLRIVGTLTDEQRSWLDGLELSYSDVSGLADDEMVAEYHAADALAFVSTYEGFGMPVIEAQACGVPVVTSTTDPLPEVAGEGALFADPGSAAQIREHLLSLRDSAELRRRMIASGHRNAQRFSPELIGSQYANLYRRVCNDGS